MKKYLIILFSILFFTACEKEEAKPCSDFLGMSFDYNGKSFRSEGKNFCAGFSGDYTSAENLFYIGGYDCNGEGETIRGMAVYINDFVNLGTYDEKSLSINIAYRKNGRSIFYQKLLDGTCDINSHQKRVLTDAGYTKGYISGSFNFVLTDSAFTDTFNITNGRFCISY